MTLARQLYIVTRGRDSPIDIPLLVDSELADSIGITRCDLVFKRQGVADLTISSVSSPSMFTLQYPSVIDGLDVNIVRANLRTIASPPTDGRYAVDVYLWDAEFSNGRLWGRIDVEIRPAIP